jgi:hypothetical protein
MNRSFVKAAPPGDFAEVSVLFTGWETMFQTLVRQRRPIKFDIYPNPDILSKVNDLLCQQGYRDLVLEKDPWQHFLIPNANLVARTMSVFVKLQSSALNIFVRVIRPVLSHSWTSAVLGVGVLILDLVTGPFLQFPILFVIPVTLAAWYNSARLAYALAALLPFGQLLIAAYVDNPFPFVYIAVNCLIRIAVLVLIAFLVSRTARKTGDLQEQTETLIRMCAWSRSIEYQGQWISFEQYLKRRFNIETTHGISPAELQKLAQEIKDKTPSA